ncbi:MAG: hypothetical protein IT323_00995 [Anaerolineae bacterium]|nr:hypothetical protein [Anaerolineae bacterium]
MDPASRPITPPRPVDYRWALDANGRPVPVELAQRHGLYTCPLCGGRMIPRQGTQLQYHYGHQRETGCPPEAVHHAMIRRWIALHLRDALAARQAIPLRWKCPLCGQTHTADLLGGVARIEEGYPFGSLGIDVALLDEGGHLKGAITVERGVARSPLQTGTHARPTGILNDGRLFLISVPNSFAPAVDSPSEWLSQTVIQSGPCPNWTRASAHIVRQPETVRAVLLEMINNPPGRFAAAVETVDGLHDMARMGDWLVWLPPDRWRAIIGGTLNNLAPDVQVILQHWPETGGGIVALYYVIIGPSRAVGVRRYRAGEDSTPHLGRAYQRRGATALDVARELVML